MEDDLPTILTLCLSKGRGGLELYALETIQEQRQAGFGAVAALAPGGMLAGKLGSSGIPRLWLAPTFLALPLWSAYRLARLIQAEGVDIVHIHWARDLYLAVFAKMLCRRRITLIYTRHMGVTRSKRDLWHRFFYKRLDKLIVGTDRLQREAIRFFPVDPSRIERLYLGTRKPVKPTQAACLDMVRRHGISPDTFKIGLFGRIERGKGQHVLIGAITALKDRGIPVTALIAGHVMNRQYAQDIDDMISNVGLQERIHVVNHIEKPQELMACLDCIVLTTYCETFGLVLIEAMRAGVSVIGTAAGGVPEIIEDGETGMLVTPGDPIALACAIEELISNKDLRQRLGRNGELRADRIFSSEKHYQRLFEIYRDLGESLNKPA